MSDSKKESLPPNQDNEVPDIKANPAGLLAQRVYEFYSKNLKSYGQDYPEFQAYYDVAVYCSSTAFTDPTSGETTTSEEEEKAKDLIRLFELAAKHYPPALTGLADYYETINEPIKCIAALKLAAAKNDPEAQYKLAHYYYYDEPDMDEAVRYLKLAASQNHQEALVHLAQMIEESYEISSGMEKDFKEAQRLLGLAGFDSDPAFTPPGILEDRKKRYEFKPHPDPIGPKASAFYNMAFYFEHAPTPYQDLTEASDLYRQAADYPRHEHPKANYKLALMFFQNNAVKRGIRRLTSAAKLGYAPAQFDLAMLYLQGEGVEKNSVMAAELIELAANQKYQPAQDQLASLRNPKKIQSDKKAQQTDSNPSAFWAPTPPSAAPVQATHPQQPSSQPEQALTSSCRRKT